MKTDRRPLWVDAWRPWTTEEAFELKDVEGEVPREIRGTLYRNGPSQKILPAEGHHALHFFEGDGFIHSYRIADGRVSFTGRYVRTPSFVAEEEEGRYCIDGLSAKATNPIDRFPFRWMANTNVVHHAGKLLALVENAWPFELEPRSLESVGPYDYDGKLISASVTAHPYVDRKSGQMVASAYSAFVPPYAFYYLIEPDGRVSFASPIEIPYPVMMHSIAVTEHYVIFPLHSITMPDDPAAMTGVFADWVRWEREKPLKLGVVRRGESGPVRWFETKTPAFFFHPGNAYEDGDRIVMDACTYLDGAAMLDGLKTFRQGEVRDGWHAVPFQYELDLASGACAEAQLGDRPVEFPRLDDRLVGYPNRFGYAVMNVRSEPNDLWTAIVKYDRGSGSLETHDFGSGVYPGEPVFVPRSANAAEDDGFVLSVVYDAATDRSALVILDARNIPGKPLARAQLPHHLPVGFHGNFAAGLV